MKLERVTVVSGSTVYTASGPHIAIGNARHKVGDWVWTDNGAVFGHESLKNFRPPIIKREQQGTCIICFDENGILNAYSIEDYSTIVAYATGRVDNGDSGYMFVYGEKGFAIISYYPKQYRIIASKFITGEQPVTYSYNTAAMPLFIDAYFSGTDLYVGGCMFNSPTIGGDGKCYIQHFKNEAQIKSVDFSSTTSEMLAEALGQGAGLSIGRLVIGEGYYYDDWGWMWGSDVRGRVISIHSPHVVGNASMVNLAVFNISIWKVRLTVSAQYLANVEAIWTQDGWEDDKWPMGTVSYQGIRYCTETSVIKGMTRRSVNSDNTPFTHDKYPVDPDYNEFPVKLYCRNAWFELNGKTENSTGGTEPTLVWQQCGGAVTLTKKSSLFGMVVSLELKTEDGWTVDITDLLQSQYEISSSILCPVTIGLGKDCVYVHGHTKRQLVKIDKVTKVKTILKQDVFYRNANLDVVEKVPPFSALAP